MAGGDWCCWPQSYTHQCSAPGSCAASIPHQCRAVYAGPTPYAGAVEVGVGSKSPMGPMCIHPSAYSRAQNPTKIDPPTSYIQSQVTTQVASAPQLRPNAPSSAHQSPSGGSGSLSTDHQSPQQAPRASIATALSIIQIIGCGVWCGVLVPGSALKGRCKCRTGGGHGYASPTGDLETNCLQPQSSSLSSSPITCPFVRRGRRMQIATIR